MATITAAAAGAAIGPDAAAEATGNRRREVFELAKEMTPIIDLTKLPRYTRSISLDAVEALEELGLTGDDEFTYTMRVGVVPEKVEVVRKQLEARLDQDDFRILMEILDETDWDCSFLVDCY